MWILNICIFVSASEIRALILYFTKPILRIKEKTGGGSNYVVQSFSLELPNEFF